MNELLKKSYICLLLSVPIIFIIYQVWQFDHHFTYTLDDPYIHLELAKNIYQGTYGINLNEMSAPSSSILWPLLLVPFAATSYFVYVPLLINSLCLIFSGLILLKIFNFNRLYKNLIFVIAYLFGLNIYGLIFNGMEHSLQILLVIHISYHMLRIEKLNQHKISKYLFLLSLLLLPLVRYEGLAITLPVLVYLFTHHYKKEAFITCAMLIICLVLFSFYLYNNQLGYMPSSIVAKTIATNETIQSNLLNNLKVYGWYLIVILLFVIYSKDKKIALTILCTSLLHFLFGKYGWFGRYEVYFLVFSSIFLLNALALSRQYTWLTPLLFVILFPKLSSTTLLTAQASSNIYNQQYRMSEIIKKLDAPVAVNDLGLVALHSDQYVLDLWGLGSIDALNYRKNEHDSLWIKRLMQEKNVNYAIVYDKWFTVRPDNWIKAGELKLINKRITPASNTVSFYATDYHYLSKLKRTLVDYQYQNLSSNYQIILEP